MDQLESFCSEYKSYLQGAVVYIALIIFIMMFYDSQYFTPVALGLSVQTMITFRNENKTAKARLDRIEKLLQESGGDLNG